MLDHSSAVFGPTAPTTPAARSVALLDRDASAPTLTPAERHVLMLILDGHRNAAIATLRGTALRTIANQVTGLLRKFNKSSRAELVAFAAGFVLAEVRRAHAPRVAARLAQLNPRQRRLAELRAQGYAMKYISYELGLAPSTVSLELKRTMHILQIGSNLELCALFAPEPATVAA